MLKEADDIPCLSRENERRNSVCEGGAPSLCIDYVQPHDARQRERGQRGPARDRSLPGPDRWRTERAPARRAARALRGPTGAARWCPAHARAWRSHLRPGSALPEIPHPDLLQRADRGSDPLRTASAASAIGGSFAPGRSFRSAISPCKLSRCRTMRSSRSAMPFTPVAAASDLSPISVIRPRCWWNGCGKCTRS